MPLGIGVSYFGKEIGLHQVGPGQVFVGREDADQVFPRDVHKARQTGADPDIDGIVALFFEQFVQGDGAPHHGIALDLDAQPLQEVDLLGHDLLGQTEFGNSVNQHAARLVKGFHDGDLVPLGDQVAGHGQTRGPGADHRHRLPVGSAVGRQGAGAVLRFVVGGKPLQVADGDRLALFADDALALALDLLGADPAAHGRQAVFAPQVADGTW